jgi:hypothetical protein
MPFFSASKIEDGITASGAGKQAVELAEGLIFECQEGAINYKRQHPYFCFIDSVSEYKIPKTNKNRLKIYTSCVSLGMFTLQCLHLLTQEGV